MQNNKGKLFVLSGPSGTGKSTVLEQVMSGKDNIVFSVSATTRSPRPGETDGKDYMFISREKFEDMIKNGEFFEYAEYVGNLYGTPIAPIKSNMELGHDVILDIEVQGAGQIKNIMPEAVFILLLPPGIEELERRLRGRGTDSDEKITGRLERARKDLEYAYLYDYIVINDTVESAVEEIKAIMLAEKCRRNDRIDLIKTE